MRMQGWGGSFIAHVTQWIEFFFPKEGVAGSSPAVGAAKLFLGCECGDCPWFLLSQGHFFCARLSASFAPV